MIESFFMQNEWNDLFKYDRFDILVEVCKLFKKQKLSKNSPHKNVYKVASNFIALLKKKIENGPYMKVYPNLYWITPHFWKKSNHANAYIIVGNFLHFWSLFFLLTPV